MNCNKNLVEVRNKAKGVLEMYGYEMPPVNIKEVAVKSNIFIKYHNKNEVNYPVVVKKNKKYGVLICSLLENETKRWHIACAIGCILLGHLEKEADTTLTDKITSSRRKHIKEEVETFAEELLIPEGWAKNYITKRHSITELMQAQNDCCVPLYKLVIRLGSLEYYLKINDHISA